MEASLQAVLFDCDGTLAKTMKRQEGWFQEWFATNRAGAEWPFSSFDDFLVFYNHHCARQGGVQNVYDALKLPCDMKDRSHPVWKAYEEHKARFPVVLYPGIKDVVETLWRMGALGKDAERNRRMRLGINTTNTWGSVYRDLKEAGILQYFDGFVTDEVLRIYQGVGDGEGLKKPSTVSVALSLGLLDSEGSLTMHVGDTRNDLVASQKVMRLNPQRPETLITVGACYGYEGREVLEQGVETSGGQVYFDYLIDTPEQLIDIVAKYLPADVVQAAKRP